MKKMSNSNIKKLRLKLRQKLRQKLRLKLSKNY